MKARNAYWRRRSVADRWRAGFIPAPRPNNRVVVYDRSRSSGKVATPKKRKSSGRGRGIMKAGWVFINKAGQTVFATAKGGYNKLKRLGVYIRQGGELIHRTWNQATPEQRQFAIDTMTNVIEYATGYKLSTEGVPEQSPKRTPSPKPKPAPKTRTTTNNKGKYMKSVIRSYNKTDKASYSRYVQGKYRRKRVGEYLLTERRKESTRAVTGLGSQRPVPFQLLSKTAIHTAATNWMPANPTAVVSSSSIGTAGLTSVDKTAGFYVKTVTGRFEIANSANILTNIVIYDLLPKVANESSLTQQWSRAISYQEYGTKPTGYTTVEDFYDVGSRPERFWFFNKCFKTCRKTQVKLAPGEIHYHNATWHLNRIVRPSEYTGDIISSSEDIPYITPHILIIVSGSVVHDTSALATTGTESNTNITYGNVAVDVVLTRTTTFSYKPEASYMINSNNLDTTFTTTTGVTVDEDGQETTVNR